MKKPPLGGFDFSLWTKAEGESIIYSLGDCNRKLKWASTAGNSPAKML
jgi:hypothetical protein